MQHRLALGFILITVLIDHIGIAIIFPIMPDLMRELTHTDLAAASLWGGVLATRGEAFFKVRHDSSHPFIVRAGSGQTRVTGTQFNVWMYEDQVRVNLIEGSVLVSSNNDLPGDGLRLEPSMQARYKHGDFTPQISQTYANDSSLAWRHGKLVLDNLALSEALPLINRYLNTPVMVADSSTGSIRLGGIYNIKELNSLVATLPKVLPVYLTRNKDGNQVLNSMPQQPPKS